MKNFIPGLIIGFILFSCATAGWTPPPSWTLREDGHIRASQRKEDFTVPEFIAKIKKEENKTYGLVLTPAGEEAISRELRRLRAENLELKNKLQDCRSGG